MRSSDSAPSGGAARRTAYAVIVAAAASIALSRPAVADRFHQLKQTSDVYALPSPDQTVVASLGYRAALADLIYAHVLVSYGLHFQEKRRFEFAGAYLDTINALDPTFREPYRYADTLLVLAPVAPKMEHYEKAREILERGTRNLPYDTEIWLTAGQFIGFFTPPVLEDPTMKQEWRLAGARILARACELASNNEAVPYHCINAAGLFSRAGEREAAIDALKRVLAVTDDPEVEELALTYLQKRLSEREHDLQQRRIQAFRERWAKDLPFASKNLLLVLGPAVDTAACAGTESFGEPDCATSWRDWGVSLDRVFDG